MAGSYITKNRWYDDIINKQPKGERVMFKKYRLIVAMLIVGLISTGFGQSVGASASAGDTDNQTKTHKFVYHGKVNEDYYAELENFLSKYFSKWNIQWNKQDYKKPVTPKQVKTPEKEIEQPKEQPAEKTPEKVEEQPTQPVQKEEVVPEENKQEQDLGQLNQFEQQVFELTNQERLKNGLNALQVDYELSRVAQEKSRDMQINRYFDHNSPTYGSPFDMMRAYGINYRSAGENIARGQRTPEEVVNAWMNSPGHRANILNSSFTHIGVGYVEKGNYWTQQFIGK